MTPGQTGPFPPNQGDPKMSDPSHIQHSSSSTPIESAEDDAAEPRSTPLLQALILGLFKLVGVGLVVYLTYFFTTMFAHRTPPPFPPLPGADRPGQEGRGPPRPGKEGALVLRLG